MLHFRDMLRNVCPPWLRNGVAEKVLYAIGLHLDALMDALVAGVKLRFPGVHSNESLPLLGRERRIRRGRTETDEVYASRLMRWLDDHRLRGGPYALLAQLHAHYAPNNFPIQLVYVSGRRFSMDVDGNITRDDIDWSVGDEEMWARWWLFYEWPDPIAHDGTWGDSGTWSDNGVWGSTLTIQDVADLRAVPREWNAAHCYGFVVLLSSGAELWGYPEGTWGDPGVWGGGATAKLGIG